MNTKMNDDVDFGKIAQELFKHIPVSDLIRNVGLRMQEELTGECEPHQGHEEKKKGSSLEPKNLGDIGIAKIAKSLAKNTTLAHLRLSHNNISDRGLHDLLTAIKDNTSLVELNLSSNHITNTGASEIVLALEKLSNITELDVSDNPMSEDMEAAVDVFVNYNCRRQITDVAEPEVCPCCQQLFSTTIDHLNHEEERDLPITRRRSEMGDILHGGKGLKQLMSKPEGERAGGGGGGGGGVRGGSSSGGSGGKEPTRRESKKASTSKPSPSPSASNLPSVVEVTATTTSISSSSSSAPVSTTTHHQFKLDGASASMGSFEKLMEGSISNIDFASLLNTSNHPSGMDISRLDMTNKERTPLAFDAEASDDDEEEMGTSGNGSDEGEEPVKKPPVVVEVTPVVQAAAAPKKAASKQGKKKQGHKKKGKKK